MEFKINDGVPVPEIQRGFSHGFPWDDMKAGQSFVVPHEYWTKERNMPDDKATAKDAMRRIRSNFIKWRQQAKKPNLSIAMKPDYEKQSVAVWLVNKKG